MISETQTNVEAGAEILIVDDERVALKNLTHVLRKEAYRVTAAASGPAGMKALRESGFDLVLTDLRMEKVDGMDILRYCREVHPDTAVIMITGYASVDSAVDAMKEGAFHYIAKPFRLDEVRHPDQCGAGDGPAEEGKPQAARVGRYLWGGFPAGDSGRGYATGAGDRAPDRPQRL